MSSDTFVFDTYAIIEVITGNKNYEEYFGCEVVINDFIVAELAYWLVKRGEGRIDFYLDKYGKFVKDIEVETIRDAMRFRYKNKKKKMSTTDCVSYLQARELGIKFLTGDKEFEGVEGVEFVR